jgi:hypothetical protein
MDESIKKGLLKVLSSNKGLVLGSNDFFYTEHLDRHPCVEFVYLYGWYLKSLGVDTIFVENHYIEEPIQTRGFLGQLMYCCFLFDFRVIGLEFKGTMKEYEEYTGKQVTAKATTIGYNESDRLLRLNTITKDIVMHQQRGKWILFCGMSHVNDTKVCKGIRTLLGVPGVGIQMGSNSFRAGADFVDGKYRRPTDYLIKFSAPEKYSARLYVDSSVFSAMYALLYFFSGYRGVKGVERIGELFRKVPTTVYPMWYDDMARWMFRTDPSLEVPDVDKLGSITFEMTREVCTRQTIKGIKTALTDSHMNEIVDTIVLFLEEDLEGKYKDVMKMIFLERKTLPIYDMDTREFLSEVKSKFQKQLHRSENHLYELFQIMSLLGMNLPKTRVIKRLFNCPIPPNVQYQAQPL